MCTSHCPSLSAAPDRRACKWVEGRVVRWVGSLLARCGQGKASQRQWLQGSTAIASHCAKTLTQDVFDQEETSHGELINIILML